MRAFGIVVKYDNCAREFLFWLFLVPGFKSPCSNVNSRRQRICVSFLKFLEAYAPFEGFYKCPPCILIEIINQGAHTHYYFCMPWELLVGLACCPEPSLAGQSSYWPGFQQKQYSNQHIPVECFRFQLSNIFLWKSLFLEESLQSRIFPCLGPSGTTKFPAGCVFRERTVHRLP